jgi:hypothetical protein
MRLERKAESGGFKTKWREIMAYKLWYTERYDWNGRAAKWWAELPDFAAVRAVIVDARLKGEREIIRVLAPPDAPRCDLDALEALGAQRG